MRYVTTVLWGFALALYGSNVQAGMFSSTRTIDRTIDPGITYSISMTTPRMSAGTSRSGSLTTGVNSVSLMVDTDADTGFVSGVNFKPFTYPTGSINRSMSIQRTILDVPADFPIPEVTHTETEHYSSTLSVTGFTSTPMSLSSSSTGDIKALNCCNGMFRMLNTLTIDAPSFFISGTYVVNAPGETRTVPFSVEYRPVSNLTTVQRIGVQGSVNFTDEYRFILGSNLNVTYRAVNPVIFDEQIGEVRFRANFSAGNINLPLWVGVPIPEPTALALAGLAAIFGLSTRGRHGFD